MAYMKDGMECFDDVSNLTVQTAAEKAQRDAEQAEAEAQKKARLAARQTVLDKLGLTAAEVALLLG